MENGVSKREREEEEEEDTSPQLVGKIVEKGFSDEKNKFPLTPSLPLPSVLPFPVARHRSHGPHWAPLCRNTQVDVDQIDEDKDNTDFNPIASFANPIKRKQKQKIDFSRWKELGFTQKTDNAEKMHTEVGQVNRELKSGTDTVRSQAESRSERPTVDNTDKMHIEEDAIGYPTDVRGVGDTMHSVNMKHEYREYHDLNVETRENEQGPMSVENQIDAENRAHLQHMSAEEIAEAQRELTEKLKPGLVEMLKKRGRSKLVSKPKTVTSNAENAEKGSQLGTQHNANHNNEGLKSDPCLEEPKTRDVSVLKKPSDHTQCSGSQINLDSKNEPTLEEPKTQSVSALKPSDHTHDVPSTGEVKKVSATSKWHAWSAAVEAVKQLRFSMDGTVLNNRSLQEPGDGSASDLSQGSIERVAERDFLRTEGDPGRVGYTIKEAVALSRSMVPGQRSLALQLLASVLDKALCEIQKGQVGWDVTKAGHTDKSVDWQAVWAYTLGPDPELALSLRMALDDSHVSVVFTTVKVLHCILSCNVNESFFDSLEKMAFYEKVLYTAPIFRSRPGIEVGFLHGGFWKYNTKPSNILPLDDETEDSENEGNRTIKDDVVVAGQDFAAGLIRMGIIPRIHYLLATDPNAVLEEDLISILIGLARHSPLSANSIIKFPMLVQTIVDRFILKDTLGINPSKIKSTTLLKVLAQSDKNICIHFIEKGIIRDMMWQFYRHPLSLDQWMKHGREHCKLMSELMIEQLRLWKVCIQYGYCISYFADFFPVLCLWLTTPNFETLIEKDILGEFSSVTREAYLVLESLAKRLPNLHSVEQLNKKAPDPGLIMEMWSWNQVTPMVESALKWISLKDNPFLSKIIDCHESTASVADASVSSIVWVISAVLHMLCSILDKIAPGNCNNMEGSNNRVPWLPEFVPKIGIEIVKNKFLHFSGADNIILSGVSIAKGLCYLRLHNNYELSSSSVCCLHGIVQLIGSLDKCVQSAKLENYTPSSGKHNFAREGKIVEDGLFFYSQGELKSMLVTFMTLISSSWHEMQCIETFGRGGTAPGIGLGWGAPGGGFWSMPVLLEQAESLLLLELFGMFQVVIKRDEPTGEDATDILQRVNAVLGVCLIAGPKDTIVLDKALEFLIQAPVLKYLDFCVHRFLSNKGAVFGWKYKEEDYLYTSEILKGHFRNRWLCIKEKSKSKEKNPNSDHETLKKSGNALDTIYEDSDALDVTISDPHYTSMVIEWAHQRLPLPIHWFLSPISTIVDAKDSLDKVLEVAKSGLFFLLGLEAMSSFPCSSVTISPVHNVPLIWKIHSLSVVLLAGMDVLQDEKSRDVYRVLQDLYGQLLKESRCSREMKSLPDKNDRTPPTTVLEYDVECLKFQSDVHASYTTFIDIFVEQFGAESYGDVLYARQVSMYLHPAVEAPVRLAAWNALSSAYILELLPPLEECFAGAEGYLDVEDREGILEAFAKSWVSGGLDKAALRGSMTYTLALHHLSSFIFHNGADDKKSLRNKLAKSLVRDYSRKQKHEGMILDLIQYKPPTSQEGEWRNNPEAQKSETERRLRLLAEVCEGETTLSTEIEKLRSSPKLLGNRH